MCVSSLMRKSKCVYYNVVLANIQFQATFGDPCSTVYMLHHAIVLGKAVCWFEMNHNYHFKSEICDTKMIQ